jgi:hypothetical protein
MATKRDLNIIAMHVIANNETLKKGIVNYLSTEDHDTKLPDEVTDWVIHMNMIPFPPDKIELNNVTGFRATWFFNTPVCIESDEESINFIDKFLYLVRWECGKRGRGAQMMLEIEYEEDPSTVLDVQLRWSGEPNIDIDKLLLNRAKYPLDYINELDMSDF